MKWFRNTILLLSSLLILFSSPDVTNASYDGTYEFTIDGTSQTMTRTYNISNIYKVLSSTVDNGNVSTSVNVSAGTVTVTVSGGDYYDSYQPSTSCSTSITNTTNSFPSTTSCTANGITGSVSKSGSVSTYTPTPSTKTGTWSCSNTVVTTLTRKDGGVVSSNTNTLVCPSTYNYSDSDGYRGTLSRGSTVKTFDNCPPSPPGQAEGSTSSCSQSYTASYSGTVTKTYPTQYTQSYSGTIYGSRVYKYKYNGSFDYDLNYTPVVTLTEPGSRRFSGVVGYNNVIISGKVRDADGDSVTVSATIDGITKSVTLNAPTSQPSSDNFELKWTLKDDNVKEGTYQNIVVNVKDNKSNPGSKTYTSPIIVDYTPPRITTRTITSNNPTPTLSKPGDQVTLTFVADEPLMQDVLSVILHGSPATITSQGNNTYKAYRIMNTSDVNGTINFIISNIRDVVGNTSANVHNTTNNSSVKHDGTPPSFSPVTITTNSSSHPYIKDGNVITLEFTASEDLKTTPTVKFFNKSVSVTSLGSRKYRATYTVVSSDPEGDVPFTISGTDLAGNIGTRTTTTNGSKATIYRVPPKLTYALMTSNNTNNKFAKVGDTVTVEFAFDRALKNSPTVTLGGKNATVTNLGNNKYKASRTMASNDTEGNISLLITNIVSPTDRPGDNVTNVTSGGSVVFDKTPPTLSLVTTTNLDTNKPRYILETNDTLKIDIVSNEPLRVPPVVKVYGNPVQVYSDSDDNMIYYATYKIKVTDPEGYIPFSIEGYYDRAGNLGPTVTNVTAGSKASNGYIGPKVTTSTIYSDNANTAVAKGGDTVYVEFVVDRTLKQTPSVTIGGQNAYVTNPSGNRWVASRRVVKGDQPGIMPFEISGLIDQQNTPGVNVIRTTDNSSVTVIADPPVITFAGLSSNKHNNRVTVGDEMVVTFTSNQTLNRDPVVLIAGKFAEKVDQVGNTYTYSRRVVEGDQQGSVSMRISNIVNLYDEQGTIVTSTTNGSSLVIDTISPTEVSTSILGKPGEGVVVGEEVRIRVRLSETVVQPTVIIGGKLAESVEPVSGSGTQSDYWQAKSVVTSDMVTNGTLTYFISNIVDLAGNIGEPITNMSFNNIPVTSGDVVLIKLYGVQEGSTYNRVVIPVFSATSTKSPNTTVSATIDGEPIKSGTPITSSGNHKLVIEAVDSYGNEGKLEVNFVIQ